MPPFKKRKLDPDMEAPHKNVLEEEAGASDSENSRSSIDSQSDDMEKHDGGDESVSVKTFEELGVIESLCEACDLMGFKTPTPIQAQSIPIALEGRDLIGLAETGSGKTAAFTLPILQALMDKPQPFHSLILAPTRELAVQIKETVQSLGSTIQVRCAVLVGGLDMMSQSIALGKKPHIVVATPGRLLDHLQNTKGFSLQKLKYLVMDEADRLLDLDFGPILDKILKLLPREDRKTYLFSATMSSKVRSLERASLSNPARISVSVDKYQTVSTLLQSFNLLPFLRKDLHLVHILNEHAGHTGIIFTRTVNEAQRLSFLLKILGFSAVPIHGQLSQRSRLEALNKFRSRSHNLLVATDVAARGLDIPSVDLVLNYDLPTDSKTYVHRVGRTARAGKSGKAISFVTQYDYDFWLRLEKALGRKIDEHEVIREEAMLLQERVNEAQREAVVMMKELHENRGSKGATLRHTRRGVPGKRSRDEMDRGER